jgi:hypothetical protein
MSTIDGRALPNLNCGDHLGHAAHLFDSAEWGASHCPGRQLYPHKTHGDVATGSGPICSGSGKATR